MSRAIVLGKNTVSNDGQSANALLPTSLTPVGTITFFKLSQYRNASLGIISRSSGSSTLTRLSQSLKTPLPIVVTLSGRGDKDCAAIARYRGEDIHE